MGLDWTQQRGVLRTNLHEPKSTVNMALPLTQFSTTYRYEPLHTTRHIRLLHVDYITAGEQQTALPKYSLVQHELSDDAAPSEFEAISVWLSKTLHW